MIPHRLSGPPVRPGNDRHASDGPGAEPVRRRYRLHPNRRAHRRVCRMPRCRTVIAVVVLFLVGCSPAPSPAVSVATPTAVPASPTPATVRRRRRRRHRLAPVAESDAHRPGRPRPDRPGHRRRSRLGRPHRQRRPRRGRPGRAGASVGRSLSGPAARRSSRRTTVSSTWVASIPAGWGSTSRSSIRSSARWAASTSVPSAD